MYCAISGSRKYSVQSRDSENAQHNLKIAQILRLRGTYILGCALFVDLLTSCTIFSKSMQSDEVNILGALKTLKETNKLSSWPLDQWPTYAATLRKITEEDGSKVYQCQDLTHFSEVISLYSAKYEDYCGRVSDHIKSRLSWSDQELMRDIIFMLSTHGWEKALEEDNDMVAIDRLVERFAVLSVLKAWVRLFHMYLYSINTSIRFIHTSVFLVSIVKLKHLPFHPHI